MGASMVPMCVSVLGVCGVRIVWIYTACKAYPSPTTLYLSWPISWILNIIVDGVIMTVIYKREKYMMKMSSVEYVPQNQYDDKDAEVDDVPIIEDDYPELKETVACDSENQND